jgi:5'-3' exonuclease
MIIADYSGIAISNLFTMREQLSEGLVRHMILNSLRSYNVKYREEYGEMVIACDGGNTWRKQIFPQYKASRKKNREESGLDWAEFFRILGVVRDEIRENLPFKVVHLQGLEADDIIATLTEKTQDFGQGQPVMIISSDTDFVQLHRYKNVKQFSPMKKAMIKEADPVRYLQEHILRGDSGDGVPNVLSADDVFVSGGRQSPIRAKQIDEWVANWDKLDYHMNPQQYRNFQRNQKLIDLSSIPTEKKAEIINTFDTVKTKSNTLNYLISKRCSQLIECAEEFNCRTL